MILRDLDLHKLSKLVAQQVDHVTCIDCCKYYTVPTTSTCGHTLCYSCWRSRRLCASCGKSIEKKNLKLNIPLQNLTEHVLIIKNTFEDLFNIKLDEYLLDSPAEKIPENPDPNKNVKEWLASSQNQFSAPITNSTQSTQGQIETKKVTSDIQVHTENKRISNPKEVIHIPLQQDDWDNIEEMPDTENITNKNQENFVGPMDIEPFDFILDDDYTTDNPRRSLRHKESKTSNLKGNPDIPVPKNGSGDSNKDSDKNSVTIPKNWNNVKRMKTEFSKLNKKNRNNLNVSIKMCKKTQNINKVQPQMSQKKLYSIDDNTPEIISCDKNEDPVTNSEQNNKNEDITELVNMPGNADNNISTNYTSSHEIVLEKNKESAPRVAFIKKSTFLNQPQVIKNNMTIVADKPSTETAANNDDIEITIKIGNTLTNICIKKKNNDVQVKINSDREVQTSLENYNNEKDVSCSAITVNNMENKTNVNNISKGDGAGSATKKNTASADTSTAQCEITKSIEEEMMRSLDINTGTAKNKQKNVLQDNRSQNQTVLDKISEIPEDIDMDIFHSELIKETNVVSLKSAQNTPSAILPSIKTSKLRTPIDKRNRDKDNEYDLPSHKKRKITPHKEIASSKEIKEKDIPLTNEFNDNVASCNNVNDEMFCQILDNINSMDNLKNNMKEKEPQTQKLNEKSSQISFAHNSSNNISKEKPFEKNSENVFSILENDSQILKTFDYKTQIQTQHPKPSDMEQSSRNKSRTNTDLDVMELCTPTHDEDSDKSVVEDTPQKTTSFSKLRNKNDSSSNNRTMKQNSKMTQDVQNNVETVINLSDTIGESTGKSKDITVLETLPRQTLETPVTITKFVDQIKHKSTPVARKSLKFNNECDPDTTMCPSSFVVAKTTQEKEFLSKAFEHTIDSGRANKVLKYRIAGSCLTASEQGNVKVLCAQRNWTYIEKYTKDLTHLVVGVDEENKAQRSVKFMCAIAGGKWIISYEWIQKCLETNEVVDEEQFEALDGTGEPGPRRSRLAKQKLFTGISFYCMPPFKILDMDTLKEILECSGGQVLSEARRVRASATPALLLAEPEHTQEDRFIYLAMELSVVPINYEWVLNCLGSYTLESIYELLLCPASLLPPVVAKWPPELISHDVE